jgi:hypothetical protein
MKKITVLRTRNAKHAGGTFQLCGDLAMGYKEKI